MGSNSSILSILAFVLILSFIGWFGYTGIKYLQNNEAVSTESIGDMKDATLEKSKEVLNDAKSIAGNVKEGVSDLAADAQTKMENTLSTKKKHQETQVDDLYDEKETANIKSKQADPIVKEDKKTVVAPKREERSIEIDEEALESEKSTKSLLAEKEAELKAANKKVTESAKKVNKKPTKSTNKGIPSDYAFSEKLNPAKSEANYLVVAGAFTIAANADKEAIRLQKLGYSSAKTISFASTKYKNVCVNKFSTRSEADALVNKLKKQGIQSYVHTKRKK